MSFNSIINTVFSLTIPTIFAKDGTDIMIKDSPIPYFGNKSSKVITLSINPSSREFLKDYSVYKYFQCIPGNVMNNIDSCERYFDSPYTKWWCEWDPILKKYSLSYCKTGLHALHIDIMPWATKKSWGSKLVKPHQNDVISSFEKQITPLLGVTSLKEYVDLLISSTPEGKVILINGRTCADVFLGKGNYEEKIVEIDNKEISYFVIDEYKICEKEYKIIGWTHPVLDYMNSKGHTKLEVVSDFASYLENEGIISEI